MEIKTKRLKLKPLDANQLRLSIDSPHQLDQDLNLEVNSSKNNNLDEHFIRAIEHRIKMINKHKDQFFWYTNWCIIHEVNNVCIGGIMVMSEPDENGEVEFGYGIDPEYQNQGYMTEVLEAMINWAFENPNLKYIITETEKWNISSQKVSQKVGMTKYKETEECFWWRIGNPATNH